MCSPAFPPTLLRTITHQPKPSLCLPPSLSPSFLPLRLPLYRFFAPFSSSPVYMFNNNESADKYTFCPDADTTFAMSLAASILRSFINAGFSRMAFPTRAADCASPSALMMMASFSWFAFITTYLARSASCCAVEGGKEGREGGNVISNQKPVEVEMKTRYRRENGLDHPTACHFSLPSLPSLPPSLPPSFQTYRLAWPPRHWYTPSKTSNA